MGRRLELQAMLIDILGSSHVYHMPPENVKMNYPCIVYLKDDERNLNANDSVYGRRDRYLLTVIDSNPDSSIAEEISKLKMCKFNRKFIKDGLVHNVYQIYF